MGFRRSRSESKDSDLSFTPEQWDEKARGWILGRLTRGPRSKHQLFQMLVQKGVPEEISTPLLDRFEDVGLIDDAAYARAFTNYRRETRGLAKSALKRELSQAGVAAPVIEETLEPIDSEADLALATDLVRRRWSSVRNLDWQARQRRLAGFLGRRGFSGSVIGAAIRAVDAEVAAEADAAGDA